MRMACPVKSRMALLLAFYALLSACSFGARSNAPDLYVLKAGLAPAGRCAARAVVRVDLPDVAPGLDGSRIAVFDTPMHLNYYTGAGWASPLPRMVQGVLSDAFVQSKMFKGVSAGHDGGRADILVLAYIRDFEVRGVQSPEVYVHIVASIVNAHSGALIKAVPFETALTPEENHMPSIVKAFNAALNEAALEIVDAIRPGCSSTLAK